MNQIKILIVEDEILHSSKIEMTLDKLGYEHLGTVDNSVDALEILSTETPDFILMDVNIAGDYDGIELASMINAKRQIPIIFITSLQDDMTFKRIKRENPVAFIQKPFSEMQIQRSLELAIAEQNELNETGLNQDEALLFSEFIFVKNKSVFEKISVAEIVYIESEARYCTIFMESKRFVIRSSLSQLVERLNPASFFQSHKSFVINLTKVDSINSSDFTVNSGNYSIPLSRRLKDDLISRLDVI